MITKNMFAAALLGVATAAASPAARAAEVTPVAGPMIAKIIGETCPNALSPAETAELTKYVEHLIAVEKAKGPDEKAVTERLVAELEADYRSNRTCGVGDSELAKDMLQRVRREVETIH